MCLLQCLCSDRPAIGVPKKHIGIFSVSLSFESWVAQVWTKSPFFSWEPQLVIVVWQDLEKRYISCCSELIVLFLFLYTRWSARAALKKTLHRNEQFTPLLASLNSAVIWVPYINSNLTDIQSKFLSQMVFKRLFDNLIRKKPQEEWTPDISLKRCLSAIDLISLGVGTTVGTGLYVIIGTLARNASGPSVVLSLLLASNAAFLCGLSFAEYGSRFPDGGSSYMYTYATLGEISAFVVGWNIALEFLLTGASLARTCSELLNYGTNGTLFAFFSRYLDWGIPGRVHFPDLLAAAFVLAVMTILCLGVRSSANFHNAVTIVNLAVIAFMIFVGFFFTHFKYWEMNFASYGLSGVLPGAAQAFFAFSGFDVVAEAAEEAIYPEKNVPKSFLVTIIVSTLCYIGVAIVLTLMVPSHSLDIHAPLAEAFGQAAFPAAQYIILIGGVCATISVLFCAVYSTSRVVYCMSVDGLLFKWFAKVHSKTQVPLRATLASGIVTALLALLLNVNDLVR